MTVWDVQSGTELHTLSGHGLRVNSVAFLNDRRLVSTSDDRTVKLWDVQSGETVLTLRGHTGAVLGLACHPDGNQFTTTGADGVARVWDTLMPSPDQRREARIRAWVESRYARHLNKAMVVDELYSDHTLADEEKNVAVRLAADLPEPGQAPWFQIGLETLNRTKPALSQPSADRSEQLAFVVACAYHFLSHSNRDAWRGPWPQAGVTPIELTPGAREQCLLTEAQKILALRGTAGFLEERGVIVADSQQYEYPATGAADADIDTIWHTPTTGKVPGFPHALTIDLESLRHIDGLLYVPWQDDARGRVKEFEIRVSDDGRNWGESVVKSSWQPGPEFDFVSFNGTKARYIQLRGLSDFEGKSFMSAAEVIVKSCTVEKPGPMSGKRE